MRKTCVGSCWMIGMALMAQACGGGSVGTSRDGGVDARETVIKLDPTAKADAAWAGVTGAGDSGSGVSPAAKGDAALPGTTITGDAGSGVSTCHGENGACGTSTDVCCDGFVCGTTNLEPSLHCMKKCAIHDECSTGCCAPLGASGITVCLPRPFCPDIFCSTEEQSCASDVPCCDGLACAVFNTSPATSACKRVCTRHEDCATGCCAPLGTSGTKACLAQSYCPTLFCRTEDQSCLDQNPCCDGLACAVFPTTPVTSACRPICKRNEDCQTGCCVSLGKDYPNACLDKTYCGR